MNALKTPGWLALAVGLVVGLIAGLAFGEQQAKAPDAPSNQPGAAASTSASTGQRHETAVEPQKTLTLSVVTRVDTDGVARRAAQSMAGAHAKASKAKVDGKKSAETPDVVEFQPGDSDASAATKPIVAADRKDRKAPLKNIHGSVYGAAGAGGHEDAGSVGATSRSGKTSVYVETDQAHRRE